ncbi:MAG TPA: hypothetical protein VNF29_10860 [Candidatus Binataceae bacterium]|nr:hypothetical protein [Candidatus Binataceae bacterium]
MNCAKCGREIEGPVDRAVITIARGRLTLHAWCLWSLLCPPDEIEPLRRFHDPAARARTNGASVVPTGGERIEDQPE